MSRLANEALNDMAKVVGEAILAEAAKLVAADDGLARRRSDDQNLAEAVMASVLRALASRDADMRAVVYGFGLTLGSYAAQLPADACRACVGVLADGMTTGEADYHAAMQPRGSA